MLLIGILTLLSSLVVSYAVKWWYRMKISDFGRKINEIPGPWPVPFLGSTLEAARNYQRTLQIFQEDWVKKYGDIYRVIVGPRIYVGISSADYIETLLSSQVQLNKGDDYNLLREWLGEGLLIATGSKWRSRRRLLTPAFHFQILENFFDVFNEQSQILVRLLEQSVRKNPTNDIDVYPFITRCALDIICETAMGVSVHAQTRDSEYVQAVYRMSHLMLTRIMRPWLLIGALFYLTPLGWEYRRSMKILHSFTRNIIEERKKKLLDESARKEEIDDKPEEEEEYEKPKERKAFLDLLLLNAQNGAHLTDADIRDEVDTFMFEGHDTNSMALCWFLYLIAKHPEEQEKVYGELEEVFGDSDRPCSSKDVPHLKYLECCIKETLRLLPSVPAYERCTTEDIKFGKYTVPAGCSVTVLAYAVQRDPRYFPDPDSYKPERFLPENSIGRHPFCFVPFSAGPRNCIGQRFALLEEKVILSSLLRKFRFQLSPNTQFNPSQEITLKPKNGLILRITSRR